MANPTPSFIEMELRSTDTRRHWSANSQAYAPGDVLMRYLTEGWTISPVVGLEEHWHAGSRRVDVYHFELINGDQSVILPVQSNPIIRRLLNERQLRIILLKSNDVALPV